MLRQKGTKNLPLKQALLKTCVLDQISLETVCVKPVSLVVVADS